MANLIQNAVHVLTEDIYLVSIHQHDYRTHQFVGVEPILNIGIDGGLAYCKRDTEDFMRADPLYEEYCLTDDEPFEGWITDRLLWNTSVRDVGPPVFRPIKELARGLEGVVHMHIILNSKNANLWHLRVAEYWLQVLTKVGNTE